MLAINDDFATAADEEIMRTLNAYFALGHDGVQATGGYLYQGDNGGGAGGDACVALYLKSGGHSRTGQTPEALLNDWYPQAQTLSVA